MWFCCSWGFHLRRIPVASSACGRGPSRATFRRDTALASSPATHDVAAAAAAAMSLQSCPTLCDPIDGSPPGSPVPGILQTGAQLHSPGGSMCSPNFLWQPPICNMMDLEIIILTEVTQTEKEKYYMTYIRCII